MSPTIDNLSPYYKKQCLVCVHGIIEISKAHYPEIEAFMENEDDLYWMELDTNPPLTVVTVQPFITVTVNLWRCLASKQCTASCLSSTNLNPI